MAATASKTVLITGASSGIGHAAAELFSAKGWRVVATMRTPVDAPLFKIGAGRVDVVALDVTKPETIANALAAAGPVDVVVNNAGYALLGPFESVAEADIRRQFETNVFGVMAVIRAVLPQMRARRAGVIINVASIGGRLTFPYYSLYHASKWAMDGFSDSLRFELAPLGIRVKIIEPGPIKTEFYGRSEVSPADAALGDYRASFGSTAARMRKFGGAAPGPDVVARAIYAAATDGSSKLRYRPNGLAMLALRRYTSDRVYAMALRHVLGV